MLWSSVQIAEHMSMEDAADLQNFVELGLIPSTAQLFFTLGAIGIVSPFCWLFIYIRKGVSNMFRVIKTEFLKLRRYFILWIGVSLMLLTVLVTLFTSLAEDGMVWDFLFLYEQVIKKLCHPYFSHVHHADNRLYDFKGIHR